METVTLTLLEVGLIPQQMDGMWVWGVVGP